MARAAALQPASAAAVLSFTNAAVEEVKARCLATGNSSLIRFPHFVGTFDGFINRYFVLPFDVKEIRRPYRIVDSWQSRKVGVKRRGVSCEGFSLDALRVDDDFQAHLDERRIPSKVRAQVLRDRDEWEKAARTKRTRMHQLGFFSSEDARSIAARRVRHPKSAYLASSLSARFAEIIVDEAQDCDDHQLAILAWLRQAGTHVVVVCDPDQAIYEFRGVQPSVLTEFNGSSTPLFLTGNYRSSPQICGLAATLRSNGAADHSVGSQATSHIQVHIRQYDPKHPDALASWFTEHLSGLSIPETNAAILSHRAIDALRVVGRDADDVTQVPAAALLQAVRAFQDNIASAADRRAAVIGAEAILLRCLNVAKGVEVLPETDAEVAAAVDLRTLACELLATAPRDVESWQSWCSSVRRLIQTMPLPDGQSWRCSAIGTPRSEFPAQPSPAASQLTVATIHSAKGREFDAVLVVIPDKGSDTAALIESWRTGHPSEEKRVLYVAVTRAKKSLSIAVPARHCAAVHEILAKKNVSFVPS